MPSDSSKAKVSFVAFYLMWAEMRGWIVPEIHIRICHWLENCQARIRLMLVFRGAAKSTIFAVYKAWELYADPSHRAQIWAADDEVATKLTRDTVSVLRRHPLTRGMLPAGKIAVTQFWVRGSTDARNPSLVAIGVNSNATASRADSADFDDVEVPKNVRSAEARENLRNKIGESTHILVPGGRQTFIGTPHTFDSIYNELANGGAEVLRIPLYARSKRIEETSRAYSYPIPFELEADGLTVFAGIGASAQLLREGFDYKIENGRVRFDHAPKVTLELCTGNAWPGYFTQQEALFKRKRCRTYNEWDSQYMLEARSITETRLDPDRLLPYSVEPTVRTANGETSMWLGHARIVGATCWWDPSTGKVRSDVSAVAIVFQDDRGRRYWHRALRLMGPVVEFGPDSRTVIGGQAFELASEIYKLYIPKVTIETNGIGAFAAAALRVALKQRHILCGISEELAMENKDRRIIGGIEGPLTSAMLWAHQSVIDGPAKLQMRDYRPGISNQPDDYLDALSGAITDSPERIRSNRADSDLDTLDPLHPDWRPSATVIEMPKMYESAFN